MTSKKLVLCIINTSRNLVEYMVINATIGEEEVLKIPLDVLLNSRIPSESMAIIILEIGNKVLSYTDDEYR